MAEVTTQVEVKTPARTLLDKKGAVAWRMNFAYHVLTIMRQHPGTPKAAAEAQAYFEGLDGLNKRLPA